MPAVDTCGSIGSYMKMLVEDSITTDPCPPATFSVSSERYEILREDVQYTDVVLGGNGLTGGVDPIAAHLRSGARMVFGSITMEVGPTELNAWLPRILGNAGSAPTFATAETFDLQPFDLMMKRDQATLVYRHCAVNRALFRSRASVDGAEQVMQLTMDIIGYEEHGDQSYPDPEPALPSSDQLYWILGDGALEFAGTEYYFDAFNLMINNNLVPQIRNFLTITCLQSRGRQIRLQVSTPYTSSSNSALYLNRFDGIGELNFLGTKNLSATAQSTYTTNFYFPRLYSTRRTPATRGPGEIPLSVDLQAYRTSSAEPLTVTNNT